jgi:hypothetical protein
MNSARSSLGLVALALAGLWYAAGGTQPPEPVRAADASPLVAAPLTHENLSVYFLHGPDAVSGAQVLSLGEALERGLAVVHETGNVNNLVVENRSPDAELFIQSGDIVKGGRQDRMAATDLLLPPNSGLVALPAHCVEQGRWTGRGAESAGRFHSSTQCAAGKDLKYANAIGQQGTVWQNVSANQTKLNDNLKASVNAAASPTSFQLTLEAPAVQAKVAEYAGALRAGGEESGDIIGVVFVVNGQVTGAEVYGSNVLFRKAWPKLLDAAAVEAIAERTDKSVGAAPSVRDVQRYLASATDPAPVRSPDETVASARREPTQHQRRVTVVEQASNNREVFFLNGVNDADAPGLGQPIGASIDQQIVTGGRMPADARRPAQPVGAPPAAPPALNPAEPAPPRPLPTGGVAGITFVTNDNVAAAANGPPADGNRLNSTRAENDSTLMVESRDATRQNAVIHKSYLKK